MPNHTTVSIPVDLLNLAREKHINVSLAAQHGIRITLGLNCALRTRCKCSLKAEALQDLLLKMQEKYNEMEEKYGRLKDHAWTIQEKGKD